jgi:hypothetical protein
VSESVERGECAVWCVTSDRWAANFSSERHNVSSPSHREPSYVSNEPASGRLVDGYLAAGGWWDMVTRTVHTPRPPGLLRDSMTAGLEWGVDASGIRHIPRRAARITLGIRALVSDLSGASRVLSA